MQNFITKLTERLNEYKNRNNYSYFDKYTVGITKGSKFSKVFRQEVTNEKIVNSSIICFVNNETGEIFKPASFATPAKHARGNVNSPESGMEAINDSGFVHYLRG
jgi:hypothetical protein